jgi:hypothetical protein
MAQQDHNDREIRTSIRTTGKKVLLAADTRRTVDQLQVGLTGWIPVITGNQR